jgi:hypothetical protein
VSPIVPAPHTRSRKSSRKVDHAANLAWQIEHALSVQIEREWCFHATRRWRFDLALFHPLGSPLGLKELQIAIEIEGGLFLKASGRHNRGAGMRADLEKYNEAVLLGWRILRVLPEWVANGKAFTLVERAVKGTT